MAQYINMKQVPNGTVTAKDDRIVYDANLADSGIIYGCDISYLGNNMIHINAGYGIIKGGLFEMEDHTEYVEYAESGTLNGQIYLHLDLSADDKLTIVKETAASLHPMTQNANANFENGIYELQLCTFEATATVLQNVTQTFSVVSAGVLDSLQEIAANTTGGLKAGALAVKELNSNLTANVNGVSVPFDFRNVDGKYGFINEEDEFMPFGSLALTNVADVAGGDTTSYTFSNDYKEVYVFAFATVYNGGSISANFTANLAQGTKAEIWHRATFVGYYCGDMVIVKLTNVKAGDSISISDGYGNSITRAAIFTTDN